MKTQPTEEELGIFSMMRFDSTTSSFLVLLVIKTYRKQKCANFKRKVSRFRSQNNNQNHFPSLEFCHVTHRQDLKVSLARNGR